MMFDLFRRALQIKGAIPGAYVLLALVGAAGATSAISAVRLAGADNPAAGPLLPYLSAATALAAMGFALGLVAIFPSIHRTHAECRRLKRAIENLNHRSVNLTRVAETDGLTGLYNRRYFDDALPAFMREFSRIGRPVGLLAIDIDHFKSINDKYGHDLGDGVLKAVAGSLRGLTRRHDIVARTGGEEFTIIAADLSADGLGELAERIRGAIEATRTSVGSEDLSLTVSIGVALWDGREAAELLYRRADAALYRAKQNGRNRVHGDMSVKRGSGPFAGAAVKGDGSRMNDRGPADSNDARAPERSRQTVPGDVEETAHPVRYRQASR